MPQFPHLYSGEEEELRCTGLFNEDQMSPYVRAPLAVLDTLAAVVITNVIQYRAGKD